MEHSLVLHHLYVGIKRQKVTKSSLMARNNLRGKKSTDIGGSGSCMPSDSLQGDPYITGDIFGTYTFSNCTFIS